MRTADGGSGASASGQVETKKAAGAAIGAAGLSNPANLNPALRQLGEALGKQADAIHRVFENDEQRDEQERAHEQKEDHEHEP